MVRSEMLWLWASLLVIAEVTSHYTHQWAAHIEGGPEAASRITQQHGFTLLAEIFPDTYHLIHSRVARRSVSPNRYHHRRLTSDKQVIWAKQLKVKRRVKRDLLTRRELGLSDDHVPLNDPKWPQMWYLNRGAGLDMSVEGAWKEGVTGKGIVVTILDDGLEKDHPDLQENYDPMASYDVNGHDDNPMPRYDMIDSNRHGTRCAGEVAAVANNSLCSLGIAYHASVGGVRMLDGDVTDAVEARSLSLNPQHIDIYSASWGPDDDGKTVDGPGELATRAFINGVNKGRGGKGSIFVWASGNGGRDHDNCNCDGYTNSIWTLSISSATEKGLVPWYSEACSSTLATTYSSGSTGEKQIVTTDLHHQCTINHTGTSASAPLAAGICALALEANTDLTWRDMQHIVVATAKPANLKGSNWVTNGVGRNVSHSFGYGLMDAAAMVRLARSWVTVPTQQKCEVSAPHTDKAIPAKSHVTLQLNVKECPGVRYLEHVQAKITLMTQRRGDIEIHLTSPAGTKTMLLAKRPHDVSRTGFRNWPFMSVHTWGENPVGKWSLEIHNEARFLAQLSEWNLIFYGTETAPGVPIDPVDTKPGTSAGAELSSNLGDNSLDNHGASGSGAKWREVTQRTGMTSEHVDAGSSTFARDDATSSSACVKPSDICLECADGWILANGLCEPATADSGQVPVCEVGRFWVKESSSCHPCHYTCRRCTGVGDNECSECFPDAVIYEASGEKFCFPKSLLPSVHYTVWLRRVYIGLAANVVLLILAGVILCLRERGCRWKTANKPIPPVVFDKMQYKLTANDSDSDN